MNHSGLGEIKHSYLDFFFLLRIDSFIDLNNISINQGRDLMIFLIVTILLINYGHIIILIASVVVHNKININIYCIVDFSKVFFTINYKQWKKRKLNQIIYMKKINFIIQSIDGSIEWVLSKIIYLFIRLFKWLIDKWNNLFIAINQI